MKVVTVMFDTLNRRYLSPYGCDWTHTPNFDRLAKRSVAFDRSYVCSMPCMPARRDWHTGRPNFLHRSWGPLEPFDDSMPQMLKQAGVQTHLATDHYHYFEDGGCTYHTKYATWEFFRGQEGDPWKGQTADPPIPDNAIGNLTRQEYVNRQFMRSADQQPQSKTFKAGLEYIHRNHADDNWMLHIETFDPHEPFFSQREYHDLFAEHYEKYRGRFFDWPKYEPVEDETPEEVEHLRFQVAALTAMCDAKLGDVLDAMDEHEMWDDTMLIVWTDHGFLLGEHEMFAKCWMPMYEEIAHTPFFVWDPRSGKKGERRQAVVQPAIDLPVTLLRAFGQEPTDDMTGCDLAATIADDSSVRQTAIFGMHGEHLNVTDGRYVLMQAPEDPQTHPSYEYTLMPTHMRGPFTTEELAGKIELSPPFKFTKDCSVMRIPGRKWFRNEHQTALYDVEADPGQVSAIDDAKVRDRLLAAATEIMQQCDAPSELYERFGMESPTPRDG